METRLRLACDRKREEKQLQDSRVRLRARPTGPAPALTRRCQPSAARAPALRGNAAQTNCGRVLAARHVTRRRGQSAQPSALFKLAARPTVVPCLAAVGATEPRGRLTPPCTARAADRPPGPPGGMESRSVPPGPYRATKLVRQRGTTRRAGRRDGRHHLYVRTFVVSSWADRGVPEPLALVR